MAADSEDVVAVRWKLQKQAAIEQVLAVPLISRVAQEILEHDRPAREVGDAKRKEATSCGRAQIHDRQSEGSPGSDPQPGDEPEVAGIALPRRSRLQADRRAASKGIAPDRVEQAVVERADVRVGGLGRPSIELDGRPVASAFELTVVKEEHARDRRHDDSCRALAWRGEARGGARFVVVLEKADRATLVLSIGAEMGRNVLRGPRA